MIATFPDGPSRVEPLHGGVGAFCEECYDASLELREQALA